MSVYQLQYIHTSPQASQQTEGSDRSSCSIDQSSSPKAFEQNFYKFESGINGNLMQTEMLNTSGELSTKTASRSCCDSPPQSGSPVSHMLDQNELIQRMQAKNMLDTQKQMSFEPYQPRYSLKDLAMRSIDVTPFENIECNDEVMESKFLPRDLLSCEEDSSPETKSNTGERLTTTSSDSVDNYNTTLPHYFCRAPDSEKQNEEGNSLFSQARVSAFDFTGPTQPFYQEPAYDSANSGPSPKYNSIFSFNIESQDDQPMEHSSIFSAIDESQLQFSHQKLDDRVFENKKETASVDEYLEKILDEDDSQKNIETSCKKPRGGNGFEFPDGGWECSKCQNYNFKGRKECHRCKKPRTVKDTIGRPEHMFQPEQEKAALKAVKNKQKRMNKAKKLKEAKALLEQQAALATENPDLKEISLTELTQQLKKMTQERAGDWACQRCGNHNFSFRHHCNKCNLTLQENDEMLVQRES